MLNVKLKPASSLKILELCSPVLALLCTVIIGVILLAALGKDPARSAGVLEPIKSGYAW